MRRKTAKKVKAKVDPTLLSVRQVCERFGVSSNLVYRSFKLWPHYRVQASLKFRESELLEFFKVHPQ